MWSVETCRIADSVRAQTLRQAQAQLQCLLPHSLALLIQLCTLAHTGSRCQLLDSKQYHTPRPSAAAVRADCKGQSDTIIRHHVSSNPPDGESNRYHSKMYNQPAQQHGCTLDLAMWPQPDKQSKQTHCPASPSQCMCLLAP